MTILLQLQALARSTLNLVNGMFVVVFLCAHAPSAQALDDSDDGVTQPLAPERFAIHAQFTYVEQETDSFRAPYAGSNSLSPKQGRETTDFTLFFGTRLWSGAQLWINPEVDQGF